MMKMNHIKIILVLILLVNVVRIKAQDSDCPCNTEKEKIESYENYLVGKAFINRYPAKNIQFFNNWLKGDVFLTDGSIIRGELLRYSGRTDELLWMRNSDYQVATVIREQVSRFVLLDEMGQVYATFVKVKHKNLQHSENNDMYLQLLADGKVNLYKKYEVLENKSDGQLYTNTFYYIEKDGKFERFKPGRWTLYRLFDQDKETIKHIVHSNHIVVRKEPGLIKAISEFNNQSSGSSK